jgi:hypothetical protein
MRRIVTVSIGLLLLAGCGSSRPPAGAVSGTIMYNGKPVNGPTLLLYPTAGAQTSTVSIPVSQEGTFRITEVPVGEYKIVVQPSAGDPGPPTKNLSQEMKEKAEKLKTPATITIPQKYTTKEKTDLSVNVTKGEVKVPLELKD